MSPRRIAGITVPVLAVRALVVVSGLVALLPGRDAGVPLAAVLFGLVALGIAGYRPGSAAPAAVLAAAVVAWALKHGTTTPPVTGTLLLALAVAAHHQAAALAAALPLRAAVDPAVPAAAGRHAAVVLALSAAVAGIALGVDPPGSVPLELLGLAAAVLAAAIPVLLARVDR